ncbi:MAG: 6,7-dimethyl-8-ribityllumazine synthase [Candidatus Rokubacteria bacterium]|nr:6,7-dimethyl-8-ribityllumazine synthase [Candidatus Rokubacteria bacterium]
MSGAAPKRQIARGPRSLRFGIVVARFNESISKRLLDGAVEGFSAHGVPSDGVEVHWVPGSFELPLAALHLARTGRFAALVCLGVVIRGQTPHFEHVAREAAAGIRQAAMQTGVPITFGVLTALSEEQARERAGGAVGNRGEEAALAALEMAGWVSRMRRRPRRTR